jgi:cell wall-associated NlpC family hydrolase
MPRHNTHRAHGPAATPLRRRIGPAGLGGAAAIGSLLLSTPFVAPAAQAAPSAPASTSASGASAGVAAAPHQSGSRSASIVPTYAKISTRSTLYQGKKGKQVKILQSALNSKGAKLKVDGKFGPATKSAVKKFQRANGLSTDGRVGPKTRAAINTKSSKKIGSSSSSKSSSKSSTSSTNKKIVKSARAQVGTRYKYAGSSPSGFDCSGLTSYAYKKAGVSIPRTSSGQANAGKSISKSKAQPGDIVVWPGHVGIYAGGNKVIDAGSSKGKVSERSIWGSPSFVTYR